MVRTIVTPENTHIEFDIPAEYVGKKLEITYQALEEEGSEPKKKTMADFWGTMSDETAKSLHDHVKETRDEWDRDI